MRVYTGGTFDLFHDGHVNLLRKCSQFGAVTVGINSDKFVEHYKKRKPILNERQRSEIVAACRYVTSVVLHDDVTSSIKVLEYAKPEVIAIGSDWAKKDYYAQLGITQDWLDEKGIQLLYVPYTRNVSTTAIRKAINDCSRNT